MTHRCQSQNLRLRRLIRPAIRERRLYGRLVPYEPRDELPELRDPTRVRRNQPRYKSCLGSVIDAEIHVHAAKRQVMAPQTMSAVDEERAVLDYQRIAEAADLDGQ